MYYKTVVYQDSKLNLLYIVNDLLWISLLITITHSNNYVSLFKQFNATQNAEIGMEMRGFIWKEFEQ